MKQNKGAKRVVVDTGLSASLLEDSTISAVGQRRPVSCPHLGLVFERCCVDKPLPAGTDHYGLLGPPVVRVAVDAALLLQQSATCLQHGDHCRGDTTHKVQRTDRGCVYPGCSDVLPLSVPSVITARFWSSGPARSVNLPSSSTRHS